MAFLPDLIYSSSEKARPHEVNASFDVISVAENGNALAKLPVSHKYGTVYTTCIVDETLIIKKFISCSLALRRSNGSVRESQGAKQNERKLSSANYYLFDCFTWKW